jgi:alpha-1,2-mannosyltransferase
LDRLKDEAKALKIEESISFEVNKPRNDLISLFSKAKVGIHTMKFEHFGIAICELMASGIITIAHNSG